jgi:hypothetical protein
MRTSRLPSTAVLGCLLLCGGLSASTARAQTTPPPGLDAATRDALAQTVRGILVESIPEKIEVRDDWGDTKSSFSGLTWKLDGLQLKVRAREKDRNHGLWKQVEITPLDPEKNLRFQIASATSIGPRRFAFQIVTAAPLHAVARIERWRQGVKLFNVKTEADATVEMRLDGELEYDFQTRDDGFFLVLVPQVKAVDLRLAEFDWQRIGQVGGDVIHELGDLFRDPIAKQVDRQEPKAVEKLNRAITKRQDKFRVPIKSPFDLGGWSFNAAAK